MAGGQQQQIMPQQPISMGQQLAPRQYNMGGTNMYANNTVPGTMIPNTNVASYNQVNQQAIDQANKQLQDIQANPWQQQYAQQQQQQIQQNAALNQTATQGLGLLTDRLDAGKSVFGKNAQELATSQGFTDIVDEAGNVTETAADQAASAAGNANLYGQAANLVGQGVTMLSDDDDATTLTAGETTGSVLSGAGKGASMGATIGSIVPGVGTAIGAAAGAVIGAGVNAVKSLKGRNEARELEAEQEKQETQARNQMFTANMQGREYSGSNMGQLRKGGLWANIHAKRNRIKAGSGEKMRKPGSEGAPTDEALKRSQNKAGGYRNFYMGGGPLKYASGGQWARGEDGRILRDENNRPIPAGATSAFSQEQPIVNTTTSNVTGPTKITGPTTTTGPTKTTNEEPVQTNSGWVLGDDGNWTLPTHDMQTGPMPKRGYQNNLEGIDNSIYAPNEDPSRSVFSLKRQPNESMEDFRNRMKIHKNNRSIVTKHGNQELLESIKNTPEFLANEWQKTKDTWSELDGLEKVEYVADRAKWVPIPAVQMGATGVSVLVDGIQAVEHGLEGDWNAAGNELISGGVDVLFGKVPGFTGAGNTMINTVTEGTEQYAKNLVKNNLKSNSTKAIANYTIDQTKRNLKKEFVKSPVKDALENINPLQDQNPALGILHTPTEDQKITLNQIRMGGHRNAYKHGGIKLDGGIAKPIPGSDAVEFIGKKHEQGGIKLDPYTEVEDKETMDKVQGNDYFFSSYLKLGGKSFAARHKQILAAGGKQKDIEELAAIQEKVSGRDKYDLGGERRMYETGGKYVKFAGGDTVYFQDASGNVVAFNDEVSYMNHRKANNLPEDFSNITEWERAGVREDMLESFDAAKQKTLDLKLEGKDYLGKLNPKYRQEFQTFDIPDSQRFKKDYALYGVDDKFIETITRDGQTMLPGPDGELGTDDDEAGFDVKQGLDLWGDNWLSGIPDTVLEEAGITNIDQLLGKENKDNVEKLQIAWNNAQTDPNKKIKVDGFFGEQTRSIYQQQPITLDPIKLEQIPTEKEDPVLLEVKNNQQTKINDAKDTLNKKKGKGVDWLSAATALGGLAQLLPAYMAYKQKPDYMASPDRIPTTHLDRVRFNAEREQNEGDFRGMSKFIETSGAGPAGIAAKMAAWGKKQTQDNAIGNQEARQNAAIQANEAQLNSANAQANIKNKMYVNEYNAAQDTLAKDRKVMAAQNAVQSIAGMVGDVRKYQATNRLATATAGPSGVLDRFDKQELYKKRTNQNPFTNTGQYTDDYLKWETETYGAYTGGGTEQNEERYGGRRSYFRRGGKLKKC